MRLLRLLKNDLAQETAEWVKDDIISESQAEVICQRYGADYHQRNNRSLGYNVLVALGYLFIGLSVITLLGANWEEIPRGLRMSGLIALTMCTQIIAVKKYASGKTSAATGVFLLGNLFYGASIILIAQIYHLGEHMPDGVFWWAFGCLLIAVATRSPWIMLQTLLLALIWFFTEVDLGFYPTAFPLFLCGALWVLMRGSSSLLLFFLTVVSFVFYAEYSLAKFWSADRYYFFSHENAIVSISFFIFMYAFSHWLHQRNSVAAKDYASLLSVWSLRFGLLLMLVLSFEWPWEELIQSYWDHKQSMLILVALFLTSALGLAALTQKIQMVLVAVVGFLIPLCAVIAIDDPSQAASLQVMSNLALITWGGWLILKGIQLGISHYFFLGLCAILITALIRYIALIGDYIGGAVLFLVFAVLLLGAAKYWKKTQFKEAKA